MCFTFSCVLSGRNFHIQFHEVNKRIFIILHPSTLSQQNFPKTSHRYSNLCLQFTCSISCAAFCFFPHISQATLPLNFRILHLLRVCFPHHHRYHPLCLQSTDQLGSTVSYNTSLSLSSSFRHSGSSLSPSEPPDLKDARSDTSYTMIANTAQRGLYYFDSRLCAVE